MWFSSSLSIWLSADGDLSEISDHQSSWSSQTILVMIVCVVYSEIIIDNWWNWCCEKIVKTSSFLYLYSLNWLKIFKNWKSLRLRSDPHDPRIPGILALNDWLDNEISVHVVKIVLELLRYVQFISFVITPPQGDSVCLSSLWTKLFILFDLYLWPAALVIRCIKCCWMFVPKMKFVCSVEFEIRTFDLYGEN